MAQNTRMQQRYGTYSQFLADKNNLLPHELASVASGDPNTADGKSLNFAFAPGDTKRLMTAEDAQDEIQAAASQATADAEESAQKAQDYYNKIAPAVENAKDELDNYTDALKGTIPLDYTELSEKVQQMEIMKAPVIQGKDSGEFVTLSDSGDIPTKNVRLFGKSVQKPTTGAQLFDLKAYAEEISDAEIVDYKTGEFTLDTSNIQVNTTALINLCPKMVAGNSYLLTGETTSNNEYLYVGSKKWNFGEVFVPDESDIGAQCYFTCTTIRSESGDVAYYKDTFKNIMIVEGSSEKPYEVYTGGEAATEPTPEFPLPITSAGNYDAEEEKYEIGILVANKNFASNVNVYSGYYTDIGGLMSSPDSRFIRVSKIKIIPGVKYRISSNLEFYSIWSYDVNDNPIRRISYGGSNTISLNATDREVYIGISLYNTSGQADTTAFQFIQVEAGKEQTPYVDGKSQNTTLQIPNPLRGIPVNSEGNYTDAKGQKFLGDIVDKQKSKIYRGCGSKTFNGSETWYADTSNHTYTCIASDAKAYPSNALCDSYAFKHDAAQLGQSDFGFAIIRPYYIRFKNVNVQSLDDWKSMLQTRPITTVYPLATPTEESLTPDQLAALKLSTYQGITNIGTDTMPQVGVEVEYGCDTKIYIDNKFTELAQSLAATQNQILGGN